MLNHIVIKLFPFTISCKFNDFFPGFAKIEKISGLFKGDTEKVLKNFNNEFFSLKSGEMGVSYDVGYIRIRCRDLKNGDERLIYFDIIN